jgi:ribonuclease HI
MAKQKYYVVWKGVNPGIYRSWTDCQLQIKGFEGALYKSFPTLEQAQLAYENAPSDYIGKSASNTDSNGILVKSNEVIISNSLAVDAACSGNPGIMEYRGVYVETSTQLFHFKTPLGTNNIGEFLAIVHGLAYMKQKRIQLPIYSDSKIAMNWVKQKRCKTKLEKNAKTKTLFDIIERAEKWLKENSIETQILKWNTKEWGEIPADFGRK